MMEKYGEEAFTCEYKYDGQRAQIHLLPDGAFLFVHFTCVVVID